MPDSPDRRNQLKRVRRYALFTLVLWLSSAAAFVQQYTIAGALLGIGAGLSSALMAWSWIKSNG